MKEYKVGEQIILEAQEATENCEGCFFRVGNSGCFRYSSLFGFCRDTLRSDHKNVIFVEKKGK